MAAPVNLNRARKEKARAEKKARADENAARFGRTKAERMLDEAFWQEFRAIADEKHLSINELAALVDVERGVESGLASAIRVYILREVKARRTPVSDAPSS